MLRFVPFPRSIIRRPIILVLAGLSFGLVPFAPARAEEQIQVEITHVPYRPVHAFLRVHFEFLGKQEVFHQEWQTSQKDPYLGFGLGLISARDSDIQFETNLSYQRIKVDKIGVPDLETAGQFDIQLGGRFFPRYPTFGLGQIPVRVTFSALAGLGIIWPGSYDPALELSMMISAGLMISSGDNPSGFLVEFVYRPLESEFKVQNADGYFGKLVKKPAWGIRIAWLFGP